MNYHLLREFPPGYGGVERVAHSIAKELGGDVFFLRSGKKYKDPLYVNYRRKYIRSFILGRFYIPIPCKTLFEVLFTSNPLIAHLPCPTILILVLLSRIFRPKRFICIYWHSFIDVRFDLKGYLEFCYQFIALKTVKFFPVIVTSPILERTLISKGFQPKNINIIPCCIPSEMEYFYNKMNINRKAGLDLKGVVIVICRLDSYKRVDWLIKAFSGTQAAKQLIILGDGPDRKYLELLVKDVIRSDQKVNFYGIVEESYKRRLLSEADLLVLPSDRSNEAFGIVQLEAMASGIPSLAYDFENSGMHWVSQLPGLAWSGRPIDLSDIIQKLFTNKVLYYQACKDARARYENDFSIPIWKKRLNLFLKNYPMAHHIRSK
tara:strand:- start:141 stop:1268 length:1128 start_codon:yes stop_codon:yes gene_type:complete